MPYGHLITATVMTLGVCQGRSSIASFSILTSASCGPSAIAEPLVLRHSVGPIYASFWPCHTRRTRLGLVISGVTRQKFTKFLHEAAPSSPLLTRTARHDIAIRFPSTSATNASGISRR